MQKMKPLCGHFNKIGTRAFVSAWDVTLHCGLNQLYFLVIIPKKTPMLPNSTIRVMAKACVMEITHPFAPVGYTRPSARNAAV